MHGSPLLRTLTVVILLLLAGIPLWRMTREAAAQSVIAATAAPNAQSTVHLEVGFAPKPLRFEVSYLGKPIWQSNLVTSLTGQTDITMVYPKEGVDLEYKVLWPPGTAQCAARLSVAPGDAEPVVKTLWGSDAVDDVLTFP
jgi:hypothetical protein